MALDSDVVAADERLFVKIYTYDRVGSDLGKTYIRIMAPGDQLNIVDRPIRDDDKARFPRHWAAFSLSQDTAPAIGTPLNKWQMERPDEITHGQVEALGTLKFQTVEQVAMASDAQLQRVGMGAVGLRERAARYLAGTKLPVLDKAEVDDLKTQLAAMQEQMAALMQPKNKGGRPKKAAEPLTAGA